MAAIDILDAPCGALEAAAAAADAAACETANVQGLVEEELSAATLCLAGAYREMRKQTDAVEPPAKVERAEAPKKTDQLSSVKRGRKRLESEPPTRAPRKTSPEVVVNMCDDGSEATVVSGRVTKQRKASARLKQEAASPAATRAGLRSGRVPHRSPSSASRLICKASAPARRGAAAVKAEREAAAEQDREAASRTPIKNRLRRRK
eukprot:Polyplicarium_translucidae@DN2354_c0_g1_i1.p1